MNNINCLELAAAWIRRYELVEQLGNDSKEATDTYDAYRTVDRLACVDPEHTWEAILQVLECTENEFVLENLAAGPFETLLGRHGALFVDRIEKMAAIDPRFKWLLGEVWQGQMSADTWQRIQRASGITLE